MPVCRERLSVEGNRVDIREQVILRFLRENPGTGRGDECSKYVYEVEDTKDGRRVVIKRPASLNKGLDFTVHVEGIRFRKRGLVDMPSHSDIFSDLTEKKISDSTSYEKVKTLIIKIYECESIDSKEYDAASFSTGYPIEIVLKVIKWLFIEQDVTYWNWSGRSMLFNGLREKGLC